MVQGATAIPYDLYDPSYLRHEYSIVLLLRQAVDDLAQAGLQPACNRWSYAASREGRAQLASLLSDEAASRFLLEE